MGKHVSVARNTIDTIGELCFLCDPCRDVISKGQSQLRVEFCTGGRLREAEESPLLGTVARERLVKTSRLKKA
jgi:hypothetical protein